MRVLDLDLDFFLDRVSWRTEPDTARLNSAHYTPWSVDDFRIFVEAHGLTTDSPTPGRVLTHHDEAFYLWRDLIQSGVLTAPFSLTHVDAHSDLGMGDTSYAYIMGELLHHDVPSRAHPDRSKVSPGNFVAFAAAARWLSEVLFVQHPRQREDRPRSLFAGSDPDSGYLELKKYDPEVLRQNIFRGRATLTPPIETEPRVLVRFVSALDYVPSTGFDLVLLTQSPDYTPPSSDSLLEVFSEYVSDEGLGAT
jgi:hypothetical protein